MIKAEDLRIGNWVYETRLIGINAIVKIESIFNDETPLVNISANGDIDAEWLIEGTSLDDIEPIPLSPAILEKCGFMQMEEPHIYGLNKYRYYVDCGWFYILSDNGDEVLLNDEIEYLHQLQNIYHSLTQTELNVKL